MTQSPILKLAEKFLPTEKIDAFSAAYRRARSIVDFAANPQDALRHGGVTPENIRNFKNLLNSPKASFILNALGMDRQRALNVVSMLEQGYSAANVGTPQKSVGGDELEVLKGELSKFK